jgi:hypothetical protein
METRYSNEKVDIDQENVVRRLRLLPLRVIEFLKQEPTIVSKIVLTIGQEFVTLEVFNDPEASINLNSCLNQIMGNVTVHPDNTITFDESK